MESRTKGDEGVSDVLYFVALIFYLQAMPTKLVVLSLASNAVVLIARLIWRHFT